jgi:hypothetical protein
MATSPNVSVPSGSKSISTGTNSVSAVNQNQPGGNGSDLWSATQSINKGGMRGLGLVAAIIAEIALKEKAIDIARDYYNKNKQEYDFYFAVHAGPASASVTEAFGPGNPVTTPDKYASAASGIAKSSILDKQWYEARRRIPKYNIGQAARLDYDMAIARTAGVVAGWNLSDKYELNWADERNERAFKRKVEITNVGLGIANAVRDGMARATANLSSAYDHMGDTLASIGNGYAAKAGYDDGRKLASNRQQTMSASTGTP